MMYEVRVSGDPLHIVLEILEILNIYRRQDGNAALSSCSTSCHR